MVSAVSIDLAAPRATGCAGSALVALGGFGAGALPVGAGHQHARLGLVCVYIGLALMVLAWWWYGRVAPAAGRTAWVTLGLWAGPLLLAPPMFSRDVYSYLAQGLMAGAGMDVYRHGPSVLGGVIAQQVPAIWQDTPSPYGPVFLIVAEGVTRVFNSHLLLGVVAMRLVAVAGLALLAGATPILASAAGVRPSAAFWLAVLNPLVLIHLVGGAHNDALMMGLLTAGLAAAVRRRPVPATLLIVAAALVKAPAALGLMAVAVLWAAQLRGRLPQVRAVGAVAVTAAAATALLTAMAGTGYGWVGALDTPISPQNWSLTSMIGRWTDGLFAAEAVGVLAVLIVAVVVWTYRDRLGAVYGLGLVLVAVVVFGPALRPWYLVWGLVPLAAVAVHKRVRRGLAVFCAALALVVLPDGFAADPVRLLLAAVGALIGVAVFALVRLAAAPRPVGATR
jgi:alpha-1,6-mannosyltransferase